MSGKTVLNSMYQLLSRLGSGGFGEVWLAQDTVLGKRQIAIKFLTQDKVSYRSMEKARTRCDGSASTARDKTGLLVAVPSFQASGSRFHRNCCYGYARAGLVPNRLVTNAL